MSQALSQDGAEIISCTKDLELVSKMEEVLKILESVKIKDDDWNSRLKAIQTLRGLALGGNAQNPIFLQYFQGPLHSYLNEQFKDPRSYFVKELGSTFVDIIANCGRKFEGIADFFVGDFKKMLGASNLLMKDCGHRCMMALLRYCPCNKTLNSIAQSSMSKGTAVNLRQRCGDYIRFIIATQYISMNQSFQQSDITPFVVTTLTDKNISLLEQSIVSMLRDADPEVRLTGRQCFWIFNEVWPERTVNIKESIEPKMAELLASEKDKLFSQIEIVRQRIMEGNDGIISFRSSNTTPLSSSFSSSQPLQKQTEDLSANSSIQASQSAPALLSSENNNFSSSISDFSSASSFRPSSSTLFDGKSESALQSASQSSQSVQSESSSASKLNSTAFSSSSSISSNSSVTADALPPWKRPRAKKSLKKKQLSDFEEGDIILFCPKSSKESNPVGSPLPSASQNAETSTASKSFPASNNSSMPQATKASLSASSSTSPTPSQAPSPHFKSTSPKTISNEANAIGASSIQIEADKSQSSNQQTKGKANKSSPNSTSSEISSSSSISPKNTISSVTSAEVPVLLKRYAPAPAFSKRPKTSNTSAKSEISTLNTLSSQKSQVQAFSSTVAAAKVQSSNQNGIQSNSESALSSSLSSAQATKAGVTKDMQSDETGEQNNEIKSTDAYRFQQQDSQSPSTNENEAKQQYKKEVNEVVEKLKELSSEDAMSSEKLVQCFVKYVVAAVQQVIDWHDELLQDEAASPATTPSSSAHSPQSTSMASHSSADKPFWKYSSFSSYLSAVLPSSLLSASNKPLNPLSDPSAPNLIEGAELVFDAFVGKRLHFLIFPQKNEKAASSAESSSQARFMLCSECLDPFLSVVVEGCSRGIGSDAHEAVTNLFSKLLDAIKMEGKEGKEGKERKEGKMEEDKQLDMNANDEAKWKTEEPVINENNEILKEAWLDTDNVHNLSSEEFIECKDIRLKMLKTIVECVTWRIGRFVEQDKDSSSTSKMSNDKVEQQSDKESMDEKQDEHMKEEESEVCHPTTPDFISIEHWLKLYPPVIDAMCEILGEIVTSSQPESAGSSSIAPPKSPFLSASSSTAHQQSSSSPFNLDKNPNFIVSKCCLAVLLRILPSLLSLQQHSVDTIRISVAICLRDAIFHCSLEDSERVMSRFSSTTRRFVSSLVDEMIKKTSAEEGNKIDRNR
ncbi:putative CLIP-associating protein 1/2 [Monocercomonoides exilis]|uniref:putative CLIP-associating protein 1/2 n=1 Tax=Monocercomonoides exilis TaxID=2049356 RepID=UPI00355ABF8F|nr:putative CLIP-associating protein 1/2 [Monocercomonoides exilis]|eukprot:MONOS_7738.1-p1 / transcript=MONOS_7738.1 / gene=MONOS_7738 / organism=Monocercomonoides_exilis_PA203 / gene_product=unspecified product / transcript_product=unspecified product / location=Mono_scaffold00272:61970-65548(+) / protein_length=1192 / sequence_SO=supercontig / SO=protein_coding / is_pseudo=false